MKSAKKVGASTLEGIKAAETSLRRAEFKDLIRSLPEGHPLAEEAEQIAAEVGGDLAGLPDNHPLIVQLKQAKGRYESVVAKETEQAQEKAGQLKKARRLEKDSQRRKNAAQEAERESRHREAATAVNNAIDATLGSLKGLYEAVSANEGTLNEDVLMRNRMGRLKRMLYATERGLSESRINRILSHGR